MTKVAFFQNDIGVGGIQKSLINLLKHLDYSEFDVTLFLFDDSSFWNVEFPEQLKIRTLKAVDNKYKYLPFDMCFKNSFTFDEGEYFDLAVDFNSYQPSCALGAITVPAQRRVMWIHNNVEIKYKNEWKYRVLFRAMKGKFKYFDEFVPCSNALAEPFKKLSGQYDKKYTVIQNYIDADEILIKSKECIDFEPDFSKLNFVALGKLCHQKGYDIMLDIFEKASKERDDLHLYILGDGPDREKLENIAGDNVTFLGNKTNPYAYMNKCDAFISTSRYEGQPLNIKEAEVIGLPLYCTKNLEAYSAGLKGQDDLVSAIVSAEKETKKPDMLEHYNKTILESIKKLAK